MTSSSASPWVPPVGDREEKRRERGPVRGGCWAGSGPACWAGLGGWPFFFVQSFFLFLFSGFKTENKTSTKFF